MPNQRQSPPRIIPVLDVMGGKVVRAVGGRREEYQSNLSKLVDSCEPLAVAEVLLAASGAEELYVADLDAIRWGIPAPSVDDLIDRLPATFLVDRAGVADRPTPKQVRVIYSLESRVSAANYSEHAKSEGAIFSVDLCDGTLVAGWQDWGLPSPLATLTLVRKAHDLGYRSFVILDLARVGLGGGAGTEPLLREIREKYPHVELIAGGGVKTWSDAEGLGTAGADAVLVASALHAGTFTFPRPSPAPRR
jgi:phosphoribosylformimino-5-aminoimidazole carboxamide ribotide isomerase